MVILKSILIILCSLIVWTAKAESFKFKNISIDQGLSQTTVFDVAQDKSGNLWIATADGLNKYDSYTFTVYRNNYQDSLSLADNMVRTVKMDSNGILWVGTACGLSQYDAAKDGFRNYFLWDGNEKAQVMDIEEIDNNQLLLATNSGLRLFNKNQLDFTPVTLLKNTRIITLVRMDKQILVGTAEGLYLYTPGNEQISVAVRELQSSPINTIQYVPYKGFWVGTEGQGLYFIDLNFRIVQRYRHQATPPDKNISSDFVRAVCMDYEQRLWVGTFVGLNVYNASTDTFDAYYHDMEDNSTISQNSIRIVFPDNQGGIWLGTYFCGLDYYHPLQNRFGLIRQSLKPNSLKDDVISCIVEEKTTGNLWIGTNDEGVNYYNLQQNRFSYFRNDDQHGATLQSNNIKCILPDEQGSAWVGTHGGGLSLIHRSNGRVTSYTTGNSKITSNNVYALLADESSTAFWVGTLEGMQLFHPNNRSFTPHFLEEKYPELRNTPIFCLFRDSRKKVWIGTDKKILVWNPESKQLQTALFKPESRPVGQILCIQETSDGHIWIGTRNGLYQLDHTEKLVNSFTTDNGLPNNVVYGILEDSYGRLWLSTNNGLTCFDIKNNKFRTYTESDGIQSNQFNNYSYCKTTRGRLYFGGVKGITWFVPEQLQDNPFAPQAMLSRLTLFNEEVKPGDASGILQQSISQTQKLQFRAGQNFFGLHFSAPNYLSARKNTFQYMLEGFDKNWYTTATPEVSYSNLSPGTYTFRLNVANNDGKWSPQTTLLEIEILPAWYQTWWFTLLLLGLAGILGLAGFKYYKTRLQLTQNEELAQAKIRFFVNITHELRTPLTLILSPIQEILQRGVSDKWLRSQVEYIQRSANRLLALVNQTLDYRRAELGVFGLKVFNQSAETVAHDIYMLFYKYARQKNMTYEFISDLNGKSYPLDINYLERILLNLLSNAFKYTPDGGRITLTLKEQQQRLIIEVSDTGCGIAKEEQQKIFERFYQINKDQMSSGIGLSLVKLLTESHHGQITLSSMPGEGSVFTISLPTSLTAYSDSELDHTGSGSTSLDLPLKLQDLAPGNIPEAEKTIHSAMPENPEATLLLVDDDENLLRYLSENLRTHYRIFTATDGDAALSLIKEHPIELVITDVMMPGMDGIKLCKTIKQNINTSHIYVIMLTAMDDVDHQLTGLRNGADDYLAKPFVLSVLTTKISNLLKARRRLTSHALSGQNISSEAVGLNAADEELLKKCRAVIEKHIDNVDFSVDELSKSMGMSRSTLHLKLKSVTGESTIEFIRKIKFERACQLLQDGRYTIAEISSMVGFSTPSYFAGSFKKQMGCLPTEYLKKTRN